MDGHAVAVGTVDLRWAGSEVFDTLGAPKFRALSAPMLIGTYPLENAVLNSSLPAWMLAELSTVHVTGLAVLGDARARTNRRPPPAPGPHGLSGGQEQAKPRPQQPT